MLRRLRDRTTRVGNPVLACALSAVALAGEAGVIVGLLRGDLMVVLAGGLLTAATLFFVVRKPDLLLRTVPAPEPSRDLAVPGAAPPAR